MDKQKRTLERKRKWYHRNIERVHAVQKKWRDNNKEKIKAYSDKYRAKSKAKVTSYHLIKKYGLTSADKMALLASQGNVCAVCGSSDPGNKYGWQLDHCHKTNKVRGVLCNGCNIALGACKENVVTLTKLIEYVERHGAPITN